MLARSLPLLLLAALLAAAPQEHKPRKVAFLIGIGEFKHDLPNLNGSPQKDVSALGEELKKGGFTVVTLKDRDATKAAIEKRFRELIDGGADKDAALGKGDVLLVALCTHGFSLAPSAGKPEQPFVAAFDSKSGEPDTMIPLNALIDTPKKSGATCLYLVDACREQTDPNRGLSRGIDSTKASLSKNTAVLFACRQGQLSHQHEKADGHGLFTFAVLRTLRGGGRVTWSKLVAGVEEQFESDEFKAMLPKGKTQVPVPLSGELEGPTELLVNKGGVPPKRSDPSSTEMSKGTSPSESNPSNDMAKGGLLPGIIDDSFEYIQDGNRLTAKRKLATLDLGGGQTMKLVLLQSNEFTMGAPTDEAGTNGDENPQYAVKITKPFYIGMFEVTQAQYKAVMGSNPSKNVGLELPVEMVSWHDATEFCKKVSERTKRKVTLPSEAEWEYACRAGTKTPFHLGSSLDGAHANCDGTRPYPAGSKPGVKHGQTVEVGKYRANPWGIHDMIGNVWEWTSDYLGPDDKLVNSNESALAKRHTVNEHFLRGGSWKNHAAYCRSASRINQDATKADEMTGFRVCVR